MPFVTYMFYFLIKYLSFFKKFGILLISVFKTREREKEAEQQFQNTESGSEGTNEEISRMTGWHMFNRNKSQAIKMVLFLGGENPKKGG